MLFGLKVHFFETKARIWVLAFALFTLFFLQAFLKLLYLTAAVEDPLFTGRHRMALGADLNPDLFSGRTGLERLAACATDLGLVILWMNTFPQNCHLSCLSQ